MTKKMVDFGLYCQKCKHYEKAENEDPCWDCLTASVNNDTHRPVEFEKEDDDDVVLKRKIREITTRN